MQAPDFVFMLTRNDRTIVDALERLNDVISTGIRHVGFKDIGLSNSALKELSRAIRAGGARVYLEVVSLDEGSEAASARTAVSLNVDCLLGGTRPRVVLPIIRGTRIRYYPFAGTIAGHPSQLVGAASQIVASAKQIAAMEGIDGLDLLAYRSDGDASALISDVCRTAAPKPVIVAGSIDCAAKIEAVVRGRAAAFTVGTAALDGTFPGRSGSLVDQLRYIQETVAQLTRGQQSADMNPQLT